MLLAHFRFAPCAVDLQVQEGMDMIRKASLSKTAGVATRVKQSFVQTASSLLNLQDAKDHLQQALEPLTVLSNRDKEQIRDRLLDASSGVWKYVVPVWDDGRLLIAGAGWHNSFLFLAPHFRETTAWDPDPGRI
jgi:hypothetical protein